jgi:hypothetical protein
VFTDAWRAKLEAERRRIEAGPDVRWARWLAPDCRGVARLEIACDCDAECTYTFVLRLGPDPQSED